MKYYVNGMGHGLQNLIHLFEIIFEKCRVTSGELALLEDERIRTIGA